MNMKVITAITALATLLTVLAPDAFAQDLDVRRVFTPSTVDAHLDAALPRATRGAAVPFKGDTVWDGVLIGGAVAAVSGMIVAPYALCGSHDSECSLIVRGALGIPMLAGGLLVGGLVDKFHVQGPVVWRDGSGRRVARVGTFPHGGTGVQFSVRFK